MEFELWCPGLQGKHFTDYVFSPAPHRFLISKISCVGLGTFKSFSILKAWAGLFSLGSYGVAIGHPLPFKVLGNRFNGCFLSFPYLISCVMKLNLGVQGFQGHAFFHWEKEATLFYFCFGQGVRPSEPLQNDGWWYWNYSGCHLSVYSSSCPDGEWIWTIRVTLSQFLCSVGGSPTHSFSRLKENWLTLGCHLSAIDRTS